MRWTKASYHNPRSEELMKKPNKMSPSGVLALGGGIKSSRNELPLYGSLQSPFKV